MQAIVEQLDQLIRSRVPIIAIDTHEELRALEIIRRVGALPRHESKPLFRWSIIGDVRRVMPDGSEQHNPTREDGKDAGPAWALGWIKEKVKSGIVVLHDYGPYLDNPVHIRTLRELAIDLLDRPVTLLLVGPTRPDVPELRHDIHVLELPLPDVVELRGVVMDLVRARPAIAERLSAEIVDQLAEAGRGLTRREFEGVISRAVIATGGGPQMLPFIAREKSVLIKGVAGLTYSEPEPADALGGYPGIHQVIRDAQATFSPDARSFGLRPHRGIFLVGLPGCGKDLSARIASGILNRPLLRMSMGQAMGGGGGLVGQIEKSVAKALAVAESTGGILGISEFEKSVSGLSGSSHDGGTSGRVAEIVLNWLADQESCLVMASANDVRALPPEITRQGRWGEIMFVDLPTLEDRAEIAGVHIRKSGRSIEGYDVEEIAEATDGYSGAEIAGAVESALVVAYRDGRRELTTGDIVDRARAIVPLSVREREKIEDVREWAREHMAVSAAAPRAITPTRTGLRALEV